MNDKLNGYELSRGWFDFSFENPELISPNHSAIYFFAIEHCNRLGWKTKFGFPTQMVMDAIGIKKHETYIRYFNDLVEWGFFVLVEKSKNQYSSNIISLINAFPKNGKALGKAILAHAGKQSQTIGESNSSIDKPLTINHKPDNLKKEIQAEIHALASEINTLLKRTNPNTMDVFFMVKQWIDAGHQNIITQLKAMKTHYEMNRLVFPTKIETLTMSFMEADWIEKMKDADPERKAERIAKTLKDANRKQPELDTIGTSAPGSLG